MYGMFSKVIAFLIKNKKLILTWRFLPLVLSVLAFVLYFAMISYWPIFDINFKMAISLIALLLLATYWAFGIPPCSKKLISSIGNNLANLKYDQAQKQLIKLPKYFNWLPTTNYKIRLLKAKCFTDTNYTLKAHEILQLLRSEPLLLRELFRVNMVFIQNLLKNGNFKAAEEEIIFLKKKKLNERNLQSLYLLECILLMNSNRILEAKTLINIQLRNIDLSDHLKHSWLNNLGACEASQGNYEEALSLFRQSLDLLLKIGADYYYLEITIDNLVQICAKKGNHSLIPNLLKHIINKLDKKSVDQLMTLSNMELHYARQTNDRVLLEENYRKAEIELEPLLVEKQAFNYSIQLLRMSWNDDVSPIKALSKAMNALMLKPELTLYEYLVSLKTVLGILDQMLERYGPHIVPLSYRGWILFEFERLFPQIDKELDKLPTALPGSRYEMMGLKVQIIKNRISIHGANVETFKQLFDLLQEGARFWEGHGNNRALIFALNLIIDEYIAYGRELQNEEFKKSFELLALSTIEELTLIFDSEKLQMAYADFYINCSYYYSYFNLEKQKPKSWLRFVDESKISINHYAKWLREQYYDANKWVDEE